MKTNKQEALFLELMENLQKWADMNQSLSGSYLSICQIKEFVQKIYRAGYADAIKELEKIKNLN